MGASEWNLKASRCLEPEEAQAIVQAARERAERSAKRGGRQAEVSYLALRLGLEAGLRATEIAELGVEDLDLRRLDSARLLVRNGKGGKSRVVPIRADLAKHLRTYLGDVRPELVQGDDAGTVLLGNGGKPLSRHTLNGRMRTIYRKAGLSDDRIAQLSPVHSLRHTCGMQLYRKTHNLRLVQEHLGHSRSATTEVHAKVLGEDQREAIEAAFGDYDNE
jgi:integrase